MKAFIVRRYGPPDLLDLADTGKPVPAGDEVLVRVRATSINPYDWHNMRGEPYIARLMPGVLGLRGPKLRILGCDVAGQVEETEPDHADPAHRGPQDHARDRPLLPLRTDPGSHQIPRTRPRPGEGRRRGLRGGCQTRAAQSRATCCCGCCRARSAADRRRQVPSECQRGNAGRKHEPGGWKQRGGR